VPLNNPAMMKKPATAETWKCIPFTEGMPLTYAATFNQEDFAKVCRGLVPLGMEDNWFETLAPRVGDHERVTRKFVRGLRRAARANENVYLM
jgi:hypothetical protein